MTLSVTKPALPNLGQVAPALNAVVIDVSGGNQVLTVPARLVAAVAGNVKVDTPNQTAIVIGIAAGVELRLWVTKVYQASTTATGIVAIF